MLRITRALSGRDLSDSAATPALLVSALFDLAGRERNPRRRTVEEYLKFGATVLALDENIVFYADAEPAESIRAERAARGLADRTVVRTVPLEELRTYGRLSRVEEAARGRAIHNANPEKDTPLYRLLTWSKFELLARAIEAPPFAMRRTGWLDFGIDHIARADYGPAERIFRRLSRRIRLLRLRPFFEEVDEALARGWAPLEEQILPLIITKRPRAFDLYAGDYTHILDNYFRPHGSAENLLFQMRIFRQLGDFAGARRLGAEILASRAEGCFDADGATFAALIRELALASA